MQLASHHIPDFGKDSLEILAWGVLNNSLQGSRVILNIRKARCKLTQSMVPEHLSTLRFGGGGQDTTSDETEGEDGKPNR